MKDPFADLALDEARPRARRQAGSARAGMLRAFRVHLEDGFTCKHCGGFVSSAVALAGVLNRNHCPYCLWSRHLDLQRAGDRLCACKALMRPVGLTLKQTGKKYGGASGELMLIHACTACSGVSINRLAADDLPDALLRIFEDSLPLPGALRERLAAGHIYPLGAESRDLVQSQLFGHSVISAE